MDSIHKAMQKAFWGIDISCVPGEAFFQGYEEGAYYILEQFKDVIPHAAGEVIICDKIKEIIEQLEKE